ncbi:hypothetical protein VP01_592g3 [Puccinia sorghi]|uniref:Uncharacterized protein n=1 Tax=Puccinia sorghi TaxID=27349 RepID=A0A0L6UIG7_9BASI|nr:hypothetical protein VP01_592g3 [Puccinia sorghi]
MFPHRSLVVLKGAKNVGSKRDLRWGSKVPPFKDQYYQDRIIFLFSLQGHDLINESKRFEDKKRGETLTDKNEVDIITTKRRVSLRRARVKPRVNEETHPMNRQPFNRNSKKKMKIRYNCVHVCQKNGAKKEKRKKKRGRKVQKKKQRKSFGMNSRHDVQWKERSIMMMWQSRHQREVCGKTKQCKSSRIKKKIKKGIRILQAREWLQDERIRGVWGKVRETEDAGGGLEFDDADELVLQAKFVCTLYQFAEEFVEEHIEVGVNCRCGYASDFGDLLEAGGLDCGGIRVKGGCCVGRTQRQKGGFGVGDGATGVPPTVSTLLPLTGGGGGGGRRRRTGRHKRVLMAALAEKERVGKRKGLGVEEQTEEGLQTDETEEARPADPARHTSSHGIVETGVEMGQGAQFGSRRQLRTESASDDVRVWLMERDWLVMLMGSRVRWSIELVFGSSFNSPAGFLFYCFVWNSTGWSECHRSNHRLMLRISHQRIGDQSESQQCQVQIGHWRPILSYSITYLVYFSPYGEIEQRRKNVLAPNNQNKDESLYRIQQNSTCKLEPVRSSLKRALLKGIFCSGVISYNEIYGILQQTQGKSSLWNQQSHNLISKEECYDKTHKLFTFKRKKLNVDESVSGSQFVPPSTPVNPSQLMGVTIPNKHTQLVSNNPNKNTPNWPYPKKKKKNLKILETNTNENMKRAAAFVFANLLQEELNKMKGPCLANQQLVQRHNKKLRNPKQNSILIHHPLNLKHVQVQITHPLSQTIICNKTKGTPKAMRVLIDHAPPTIHWDPLSLHLGHRKQLLELIPFFPLKLNGCLSYVLNIAIIFDQKKKIKKIKTCEKMVEIDYSDGSLFFLLSYYPQAPHHSQVFELGMNAYSCTKVLKNQLGSLRICNHVGISSLSYSSLRPSPFSYLPLSLPQDLYLLLILFINPFLIDYEYSSFLSQNHISSSLYLGYIISTNTISFTMARTLFSTVLISTFFPPALTVSISTNLPSRNLNVRSTFRILYGQRWRQCGVGLSSKAEAEATELGRGGWLTARGGISHNIYIILTQGRTFRKFLSGFKISNGQSECFLTKLKAYLLGVKFSPEETKESQIYQKILLQFFLNHLQLVFGGTYLDIVYWSTNSDATPYTSIIRSYVNFCSGVSSRIRVKSSFNSPKQNQPKTILDHCKQLLGQNNPLQVFFHLCNGSSFLCVSAKCHLTILKLTSSKMRINSSLISMKKLNKRRLDQLILDLNEEAEQEKIGFIDLVPQTNNVLMSNGVNRRNILIAISSLRRGLHMVWIFEMDLALSSSFSNSNLVCCIDTISTARFLVELLQILYVFMVHSPQNQLFYYFCCGTLRITTRRSWNLRLGPVGETLRFLNNQEDINYDSGAGHGEPILGEMPRCLQASLRRVSSKRNPSHMRRNRWIFFCQLGWKKGRCNVKTPALFGLMCLQDLKRLDSDTLCRKNTLPPPLNNARNDSLIIYLNRAPIKAVIHVKKPNVEQIMLRSSIER